MDPPRSGRSQRPEVVAALIRAGQVPPASFQYEAVRVTAPATLSRLAGFFDDYWSGPPSGTGIGACAEFAVEFVECGGARHSILLTPGLRWCMTSRGDWPMHPAFAGFFRTLIA